MIRGIKTFEISDPFGPPPPTPEQRMAADALERGGLEATAETLAMLYFPREWLESLVVIAGEHPTA